MLPFDLGTFLAVAEQTLHQPAEDLLRIIDIPSAESALAAPFAGTVDTEFYPDPVDKAAILCSRLVRNHAFPDGNKRVALVSMLTLLGEYGYQWSGPDQDYLAEVIEQLAARQLSEEDFMDFVQQHVVLPIGG